MAVTETTSSSVTTRIIPQASSPGNGRIGEGDSPNNTDTWAAYTGSRGQVLEAGPARSLPAREADGLDVRAGGGDPSLV